MIYIIMDEQREMNIDLINIVWKEERQCNCLEKITQGGPYD